MTNERRETDFPALMKQIKNSDLTDVEKLAEAFGTITNSIIEYGHKEIELARAMQDNQALVKEQIKVSVMESARGIFQDCHRLMFGKAAWDE